MTPLRLGAYRWDASGRAGMAEIEEEVARAACVLYGHVAYVSGKVEMAVTVRARTSHRWPR